MPETGNFFSVVIPLFNKEKTIRRAIFSVLNQKLQDFEIIVVNDGSRDNGPSIVESIGDPRIRLIHQENQGVSVARNSGIAEARHEMIAFLDADDEWLPEYLQTILKLIWNYPGCDVFATNYIMREPTGVYGPPLIRSLPSSPWEGLLENYFEIASFSDPPILSSAVVIRKPALKSIGGFPSGVASGEDLITWAKLAVRYRIAYSMRPGVIYRLSTTMRGRPLRFPDAHDFVGAELELLCSEHKRIRHLKRYASHWHKMRASTYVKFGRKYLGLKETILALKYSKTNFILYAYLILILFPSGSYYFINSVITKLKNH